MPKLGFIMQVVVQVGRKDSAKAWGILARHSPATALRDRIFIIFEGAARALRDAGVKFREIARVAETKVPLGAVDGERIVEKDARLI